MAPITMTTLEQNVTLGVDTHADTHTAAVVDHLGAFLGHCQFSADPVGYRALLRWAGNLGTVRLVGVEGTGSYGAGLTRFLTRRGLRVVEVDRPDRRARRTVGKSDPADAEAAARAALSGRATGEPKSRDGAVESLRVLRLTRLSAVRARSLAANQLRNLIITAPEPLRSELRPLALKQLVSTAARFRPGREVADPSAGARAALRSLARRYQQLRQEVQQLDELIKPLVEELSPQLLALAGVGPDVAAALLVCAGDNPGRLTSEAAFAALTGVSPIPASSGKSHRHRLNRGGDRQANCALYRIVLCRLHYDPRTHAYVARRTKEGLSKKEIIRCLKRYVAREVHQALTADRQGLDRS